MYRPACCFESFRRTAVGSAWLLAAVAAPAPARAQASADLDIRTSRTTGLASFVTARHGGPIPVQADPGQTKARPRDFLAQYGHLFGITEPGAQTVWVKAETDRLGYKHTTYAQVHQGIPVFSGVIKVHRDADGDFTAANGDFYPIKPTLDTKPAITAAQAEQIAASVIPFDTVTPVQSELVIVDPGWYGDPPKGARLAYHVILHDPENGLLEAFFVDAHSGAILDQWSMIDRAKNRRIHDTRLGGSCCYGHGYGGCSDAACQYDICHWLDPYCCEVEWDDYCAWVAAYWCPDRCGVPGPLARSEGAPATTDADVNAAYNYYGDTYDYYSRAFGRDSIDDDGMAMVATVNSLLPGCPNAYWDGSLRQMVFCTGLVVDDVVGHELTHGVTQFTADLIYQNQPGQLNESFSDIVGELVDLFNGDAAFAGPPAGPPNWPTHPTGPGKDTPNKRRTDKCSYGWEGYSDGVRWLTGEDADEFGGAIRDMWNPPCFGDPDEANSPWQTCYVSDGGGVHSGSGVPNHTFALLTDGGTFNGFTVPGIGPIKAGAVWYLALTQYLTIASDFADGAAAFRQAAADLIGTTPNDPRTGTPSDSAFTAADAAAVDLAVRATEMDTPGRCGASIVLDATPPPHCAPRTTIWADDFETGAPGWTTQHSGYGATYDWILTTNGLSGTAWFCADPNTTCGSQDTSASFSLISPQITLPGPDDLNYPILSFTHRVITEAGWDGGNVKIRVNGGAWQVLPPDAFVYNPYGKAALVAGTDGNTNPLSDEPAFHGLGGEWGTSLVYLGDSVTGGQTIQLRFDFGKDSCTGVDGWYIDKVELYDCDAALDCNDNKVPDDMELAQGPHLDVIVSNPPIGSGLVWSDADAGTDGVVAADDFTLGHSATIRTVKLFGAYYPNGYSGANSFTVAFYEPQYNVPGELRYSESSVPFTLTPTDNLLFGRFQEWEIVLTLSNPLPLGPGRYFVSVYNDTSGVTDNFAWETSDYPAAPAAAYAYGGPPWYWYDWDVLSYNLALEIVGGTLGADCNENGLPDDCDLAGGSTDLNGNGVPDECEDCNDNGVPDDMDLAAGTSADCNGNEVPDDCDLAAGTSQDCNANSVLDSCDLATYTSLDNNHNGRPDECDQCVVAADCDDKLFCTGAEGCNGDICVKGTAPCPGRKCDEVTDTCVNCLTDADCNDGQFCNGVELCKADGTCTVGLSPCSASPACDEATNQCVQCLVDADCADGNNCTADTCAAGVCAHTAVPACDDFDEDGVSNDADDCPNSPAGADVDANGCACSQLDDDGDGVTSCDDDCADTPRGATVDATGCTVETGFDQPPAGDGSGDQDDGQTDIDTGGAGDDTTPEPGEEPPADGDDVAEPPVTDPVPDQDEPPPGDDVQDVDQTPSNTGGGRQTSRSSGTCGLLGMVNLVFLAGGLAMLRRSRGR